MRDGDLVALRDDIERELLSGGESVGILGLTAITLRLLTMLRSSGLIDMVSAIYSTTPVEDERHLGGVPLRPIESLETHTPSILAVATDDDKETLLDAALPFIQGTPRIVLAGYGHLEFRDPAFHALVAGLLVPSYANGYPACRIHLYQCLQNAARLGLHGVVVEIGMFKGGTTMFLSRAIEQLGAGWPVIGFDTFSGFPPRRSPLDMYAHPDCVFTDLAAVQRYLDDRAVEIVAGDIVETRQRLNDEDLVLTFIDTDNYTSARAALETVRERTVVGGAIVMDHFAGGERFRYTLGERMAGRVLLDDARYFNLHGTGVFMRQR